MSTMGMPYNVHPTLVSLFPQRKTEKPYEAKRGKFPILQFTRSARRSAFRSSALPRGGAVQGIFALRIALPYSIYVQTSHFVSTTPPLSPDPAWLIYGARRVRICR